MPASATVKGLRGSGRDSTQVASCQGGSRNLVVGGTGRREPKLSTSVAERGNPSDRTRQPKVTTRCGAALSACLSRLVIRSGATEVHELPYAMVAHIFDFVPLHKVLELTVPVNRRYAPSKPLSRASTCLRFTSYLVPNQRTKWASAANRRTLRVSRPRGRYTYPKLFTARRRAVVGVTGRFWSKDAGQSQTCESNSDPTSSAIIGYPLLRS